MASNYPAQIDTIITLPQAPPGSPNVSGDVYNALRNAVLAVENQLGVQPAGTNNTVRARLDVIQSALSSLQIISLSGDLGNTLIQPHVIGIQGRPVSSVQPTFNQGLLWDGIAWAPQTLSFGTDVFGTFPSLTVVALQGRPVANIQPSTGQLLEWNGTAWAPATEIFSGDLSGNYLSQTVIRINGATVPAAGLLTAGNVLQVLNNSSLTYGPVNLAGGSHYISGVLPLSNMTVQPLTGDVTGLATSNTVTALQGFAIKNQAPANNQVLAWSSTDSKWEPTNVTAGGDLTGTYPNPTVNSIRGLLTSSLASAFQNGVAIVELDPVWKHPQTITYDGTNLWVASTSDPFVTKLGTVLNTNTVTTNYAMPANTNPAVITNGGGKIFVGCITTGGNKNKLIILNGTTGAIIGIGVYPSAGGHPTGITVDDIGNVWTVDTTNLQGFNIAALVAAYPTPVAPVKTLAIPGCSDVVFGVTTGGHHYLFVCDGSHSHIYSIDPTVPSIIATYSDGGSRTFNHLFFDGGVPGGVSLWASTLTDSHLVRINPDTMTSIANIAQSGTATFFSYIGTDGTYIYVSDTNSGKVEQFDPSVNSWLAEFSAPVIPSVSSAGMINVGSTVYICESSTNPVGQQGIQELVSFGFIDFFTGPLQLQYKTTSTIGTYDPTGNTIPLRGFFGEGVFTSVLQATTGVSSTGMVRTSSSNQPTVTAASNFSPGDDINLVSFNGADGVIIGDLVNCTGVFLESAFTITSTGGRIDTQTVLGDGGNYQLALHDRIIIFTGGSGRQFHLPTANGSGRIYKFIAGPNVNNGGNGMLIVPDSGNPDKIGNAIAGATWTLTSGGANITIQDTAFATWTILSRSTNNPTSKQTSSYQVLAGDDIIPCDSTGGTFIVTLPPNPLVGQRHEVHDIGGAAATHNITVSRNGNNINGAASDTTLATAYVTRYFIYLNDTVGWHTYAARVA